MRTIDGDKTTIISLIPKTTTKNRPKNKMTTVCYVDGTAHLIDKTDELIRCRYCEWLKYCRATVDEEEESEDNENCN